MSYSKKLTPKYETKTKAKIENNFYWKFCEKTNTLIKVIYGTERKSKFVRSKQSMGK